MLYYLLVTVLLVLVHIVIVVLAWIIPVWGIVMLLLGPILAFAGFYQLGRRVRESRLPKAFTLRYLPFLQPVVLSVAGLAVGLAVSGRPMRSGNLGVFFLFFLLALLTAGHLVCGLAFGLGAKKGGKSPSSNKGGYVLPGLVLLGVAATVGLNAWNSRNLITHNQIEGAAVQEEVDLEQYRPFAWNNQLVKMEFEASLAIDGGYPRLDGATAAFPVYGAVAETVYQGLDEHSARDYVDCTATSGAYYRLAEGETDIVFGVQPSQAQIEYAESRGVTFTMTPVCREAFVFFVNRENPVESLTREEIGLVYTRRITNWKELGGEEGAILAFQRPAGSGSQTMMEVMVMGGKRMAKPLETEEVYGMGGIIYQTASYRNARQALGYSFRFYATEMNPHADIKLLAVDGIRPTPEEIRLERYPYTTQVYAVTAGHSYENPNTQPLLDWLLSSQGQSLMEQCGYVALGTEDGQ